MQIFILKVPLNGLVAWLSQSAIITNGVIIQWGYLTNIPYGQEIYFPISFKQIARCTVNLINSGYCFINTIAVTTSYFSTSVYTSLQQRINGNIMWLAIGF